MHIYKKSFRCSKDDANMKGQLYLFLMMYSSMLNTKRWWCVLAFALETSLNKKTRDILKTD